MKTKYEVVDSEFNQKNYPDMIGQILDNPPAYANVRLIKEKAPMKEIFRLQSRLFQEEVSSDMLEDFVIKCLREGYEQNEVIAGIGEFFRQCEEVAQNIFTRAVVKMQGIKAPETTSSASSTSWYKKAKKDSKDKQSLTPKERQEVKDTFGDDLECSFFRDDEGYYCTTHRARSKSYPSISKIPKSRVEFVESTS